MMQSNFGQNEGVAVVYSPSGPLFEYAPDRLKTVPKTAEELLAYVKAESRSASPMRGRSIPAPAGPSCRACPTSSATPTRSDPIKGWDKTWAYLKELGTGIDYYPGGTDRRP